MDNKKSVSFNLETDSGELRLVQAYQRLSHFEWDELVGPKPDGFDDMPISGKNTIFGKRKPGRFDFTYPASQAIVKIVGAARISYLLWRLDNGGSDAEWLQFYVKNAIRVDQIGKHRSTL